jgi:hypothetical protein
VLQTGPDSRAVITFNDRAVAHVGDKTQVTIHAGNRTFELNAGAILTQVPKGVGRTELKSGAVITAITGTTLLVEYQPDAYLKFVLLDGTARLCLKKPGHINDCVLLRAGQMLIAGPNAKRLPDAVDVDLTRLLETCHLITDFPQLPGHDLLAKAASKQRKRKSHGSYVDTNLVIFGRGTLVSLVDPKAVAKKSDSAPVKPTPTPSADPESTPVP